jgi:hypothetical protein
MFALLAMLPLPLPMAGGGAGMKLAHQVAVTTDVNANQIQDPAMFQHHGKILNPNF